VSTLGQPIAPEWRQEVNRRLAEHKNRKANTSEASAPAHPVTPGSSRAAQAAARVAARYSKAPSYSQMQAEEARVAVRAAEIATQVALEAQSAAEFALAELHAASVEAPNRPSAAVVTMPVEKVRQPEPSAPAEWEWSEQIVPAVTAEPLKHAAAHEPEAVTTPASELPTGPVTSAKDSSGNLLHIRWQPDMPLRDTAASTSEPLDLSAEDWFTLGEISQPHHEPVEIEAHAIHANLIHFPRELVATRRMRPRLAEGLTQQEEPGTQLSIFEVDPSSIQTEAPAPNPYLDYAEPESHAVAEPATASQAVRQSAQQVGWSTAEWHGMKLDAQADRATSAGAVEAHKKPELAGLNRRFMAGTVDFTGVTAIAAFLWLTFALGMAHTLQPRTAELLGAGLFALAGLAYHAFFCLLSLRTPGMRYAGLSLCTLADCIPTQEQMRRRLGAMTVSMLPLGLGMLWSLFDEDRLSWHDRYSQTYLRHS
jgi:uncharacterized RDD family membrane protein YckC